MHLSLSFVAISSDLFCLALLAALCHSCILFLSPRAPSYSLHPSLFFLYPSLVRSLVLSFSRSLVLSFSRSFALSFFRSLVLSLSRSLVLSFSPSLLLSFSLSLLLSPFSPSFSLFLYLCISLSLFVCLCLSLSLFVSLCLSLSLFLSLFLSLSLSFSLFLSLSLSFSLFLSPSLSFSLFLSLSLFLSFSLSLFLSFSLSLSVCHCFVVGHPIGLRVWPLLNTRRTRCGTQSRFHGRSSAWLPEEFLLLLGATEKFLPCDSVQAPYIYELVAESIPKSGLLRLPLFGWLFRVVHSALRVSNPWPERFTQFVYIAAGAVPQAHRTNQLRMEGT